MAAPSRTFVLIAAAAVIAIATSLAAQGRDAWEGTWKLNPAKSYYGFSPMPESSVSKVESFEDGWRISQDTVDTQGLATHVEAFVKFDGKDYRVQGLANTTWTFISIDDHTYELLSKRNGRFTARTRTFVTSDGKSRVSTTTGTNSEGQIVRNIAIYERQ